MKITHRIVALFFTAVMLLPLFYIPVKAAEDPLVLEHATSAYLYNIENNTVIFEENTSERVYPTATVKMMVGLVAIEQLSDRLDEEITITKKMLRDVMGNNISLKEGERVRFRDLIAATLVGGANDAATVLAFAIDGSLSSFLSRMNARAVSLGAVNTNYTNASGMHDDAMYTTCADTAKIAMEAYKNSTYMEYSSLDKYIMPATNITGERTIHSKNALISRAIETKYYYKYARGLSAGFTKQGGYSVVTSASYDGASYLCVVMGAEYVESTDTIYSYVEATKLLRYAFSNYGYRSIIKEGDIIAEMSITMSDDVDFVSCVSGGTVSCYMPYDEDIDFVVKKTVKLESSSIPAPVKKGQKLGMVTLMYDDRIVGNVDLIAASDVKRSEFLYVLERIKAFASSRFFIASTVSAIVLFIAYVLINSAIRYRRTMRHR